MSWMVRFYLGVFLIFLIGFSACVSTSQFRELQVDLQETQLELAQEKVKVAKAELASMQSSEQDKKLVHVVYFKLKETILEKEQRELIAEIRKLEGIAVLHNLEVGVFQDLGDKRAMEEFGVVMQMSFDSEADYRTYQAHPLHLKLKEKVPPYLAGPPVTYDYWTQ